MAEAATNLLWFDTPFRNKFGTQSSESNASLAGRIVADAATAIIGATWIESGIGTAIGGTALNCLGDACALSPAAVVVGSAVAVEGAGMAVSGAIGLGKNLSMMSNKGNILDNKRKGDAFRDQVANDLKKAGYGIEREVTKHTPFGRRVIDIEVRSPDGELLGGIETKTGSSPYTKAQQAKDIWLRWGGYIVDLVRGK